MQGEKGEVAVLSFLLPVSPHSARSLPPCALCCLSILSRSSFRIATARGSLCSPEISNHELFSQAPLSASFFLLLRLLYLQGAHSSTHLQRQSKEKRGVTAGRTHCRERQGHFFAASSNSPSSNAVKCSFPASSLALAPLYSSQVQLSTLLALVTLRQPGKKESKLRLPLPLSSFLPTLLVLLSANSLSFASFFFFSTGGAQHRHHQHTIVQVLSLCRIQKDGSRGNLRSFQRDKKERGQVIVLFKE